MSVKERFLRYVAIDTQSQDNAGCYPSTEKQKNLLRLLVNELKEMGLKDAAMDESMRAEISRLTAMSQ